MVTIKLPMTPQIEITLLGTGGGRFATITQKRRTAGIHIISEDLNFNLDPGPGALVYSISEGLNSQKLDAVFVSHCHPDHYTDAEVLIEAMTKGTTKKRGVLVASRSVLHGNEMGFDITYIFLTFENHAYLLLRALSLREAWSSVSMPL